MNIKKKKLFDIVIKPDLAGQPWNLTIWFIAMLEFQIYLYGS
jgi:hypothetical protein